jgi:hypothetical protein
MRKLRLILLVCLAPATGLAGANAEKIDPDDWVMFGCQDSILDTNYDSGPIYQRVNQLHTAVKKDLSSLFFQAGWFSNVNHTLDTCFEKDFDLRCEGNFKDRPFTFSINRFTGQAYSSWKYPEGAVKGSNEGDYQYVNYVCEKFDGPMF